MAQLVIIIQGIDLDDIQSCLRLRRTLQACVGITDLRKPEIGKPIIINSAMTASAIFTKEPDLAGKVEEWCELIDKYNESAERLKEAILNSPLPTEPIVFDKDSTFGLSPSEYRHLRRDDD